MQIERYTCPRGLQTQRTLWPATLLDDIRVCLRPLTQMSAYSESRRLKKQGKLASGAVGGEWTLYEDRPGKPGWIARRPGASMKLRLSFGSDPMFSISYLRSYKSLGNAVIRMNGHSLELSGLWDDQTASSSHVSVAQTQSFDAAFSKVWNGDKTTQDAEGGIVGWGVTKNSSHELQIEFVGDRAGKASKFKLLSVVSC